MIGILSLSDELLCQISILVSPDSVVNLALVSRRICRCSSQALQKHGERWSKFHILHDRNPLTVPSILRSIIAEPAIAWYPRTLEVWDSREGFQMWKHSSLPGGIRNARREVRAERNSIRAELSHDYPHLDATFFRQEELQQYRELMRDTLHLSEATVEKWMQRLEQGFDEPLKVLLMALCPELTTVRFAAYDTWNRPSAPRHHPLRLLGATLRALQSALPASEWPCFQSLRTVAVGVSSDLRHPHDAYYPHSRSVAPLLLLPNVETLEFNLCMHENDYADSDAEEAVEVAPADASPYIWEWQPRSSACQTLRFYCTEWAAETTASFVGACKNLLFLEHETEGPSLLVTAPKSNPDTEETDDSDSSSETSE